MWAPPECIPRARDVPTGSRGWCPVTAAKSSAPRGTGPAGRALWASVVDRFDLTEHERAQLGIAVRVADRVAALDAVVDAEGVILCDPKRGQIAHPALVESRQQRLTLACLLTALRLPDDEGAQPQRRGTRGVYRVSGGAA